MEAFVSTGKQFLTFLIFITYSLAGVALAFFLLAYKTYHDSPYKPYMIGIGSGLLGILGVFVICVSFVRCRYQQRWQYYEIV